MAAAALCDAVCAKQAIPYGADDHRSHCTGRRSGTLSGVSFIVTVYNKRPFLPTVLAALAAQTGGFAREYVFVDDGSTDDSLAYLRAETAAWPNCRIVAQANLGASAAMNRAVGASTQPYLKLVDADDLLVPDATRWLLDALDKSGAVLAYGASAIYQPGQPIAWPVAPNTPAWDVTMAPLRQTIRGSTINPSQMLLSRAAYLGVGGADETVVCQDYSLALPLARLGSFVGVNAVVALMPSTAPGRLSDNPARILHDVTRALGNFVARHQELPRGERNFAVVRAADRARLWSYRHCQPMAALHFTFIYLLARLNLIRDHAEAIFKCCGAYGLRPERPRAPADRGNGPAAPGEAI